MSQQQTIKFTVRQDGTVLEEVIGVVGSNCEKLTEEIENRIGKLAYREVKPEYYQSSEVKNTQDVTL